MDKLLSFTYIYTMDDENEWYELCSKDGVLLSHLDNSNDFNITFSVLEKFDTICEIITERKLFELIFELNRNVITDYSETIRDDFSSVKLDINTDGLPSFNTHKESSIFLEYSIDGDTQKDDCICLSSQVINKPENAEKNHIYLVKFDLNVKKSGGVSIFAINYSLDININNVSNKFISLHLKNIFYKLKQYLD